MHFLSAEGGTAALIFMHPMIPTPSKQYIFSYSLTQDHPLLHLISICTECTDVFWRKTFTAVRVPIQPVKPPAYSGFIPTLYSESSPGPLMSLLALQGLQLALLPPPLPWKEGSLTEAHGTPSAHSLIIWRSKALLSSS